VYYFDVTVLQLAWVMFANVQRSPDCASCPQTSSSCPTSPRWQAPF
jgi:hypothetical protein